MLLALALDVLFGDPPNCIHPVAWMGKLIAFAMRFRPRGKAFSELVYGATIALGGCALFVGIGGTLDKRLNLPSDKKQHRITLRLIEAAILKATFSLHGLNEAARRVEGALERRDLPAARDYLSRSLVSRDTSRLDVSLVSAAAIESVAENTSDGILAPLFFYASGGLGMALAYRFANTADSMLGYHTPELEWLGKVPARLDDLLNYLPARMTAAGIALSAPFAGGNTRRSWEVVQHDARKTDSPNAGYPMSAMAGVLNVELEKTGYYHLGAGGRKSEAGDIRRARSVMFITVALGTGLIVFLKYWMTYLGSRVRKGIGNR
jgi:adenosylcobinamide-phosphate synthase